MNLLNAVRAGFSNKQIIDYISRAFPGIGNSIQAAMSMGYTAEQVIKMLSNVDVGTLGKLEKKNEKSLTDLERAYNHIPKKEKVLKNIVGTALKTGLGIAGGLGATYLAGQGIGLVSNFLNQQLNQPQAGGPGPGPAPTTRQAPIQPTPAPQGAAPAAIPTQSPGAMPLQQLKQAYQQAVKQGFKGTLQQFQQQFQPQMAPVAQIPQQGTPNVQQAQGAVPSAPPIPQEAQGQIPAPQEGPSAPDLAARGQAARGILDQFGITQRVENMIRAGNDPKDISDAIPALVSPEQKKALAKAMKEGALPQGLLPAIQDYAASLPVREEAQAQIPTETPLEAPIAKEEAAPPEQIEKPKEEAEEGGKAVLTKGGEIGTLKGENKGIAEIEIDGKLHKKKASEIEELPVSKKDLGQLFDELKQRMQEETGEELSRMALWVGYNSAQRSLSYLSWDGTGYTYDDIDDERNKQLMETPELRKTTGENFVGVWNQGSPSIMGTGLTKLIRELQAERGGKGKEYTTKYEKKYLAIDPAIQASKKRFEENKAAQRAEKLAEKEKQKAEKAAQKSSKAKTNEPKKPKPSVEKKVETPPETVKKIKEVKRQDISQEGLKNQKKYIVSALEDALKGKSKEEKVTIDVPGDGVFKIKNEKPALEAFLKNVNKLWPDKPMKASHIKAVAGVKKKYIMEDIKSHKPLKKKKA